MAAPTEYYVDPSLGPGGAGTFANPWHTVQSAVDEIIAGPGRDAVNGDKIWVFQTVDDTPIATLDLTFYTPTIDAPLIIQGCSTLGGYGVGGMDGSGNGFSIFDGITQARDYVHFIHMHLHNTGAAKVLRLRDNSTVIGCEIDECLVWGVLDVRNYCKVIGNYVHGPHASDLVLVGAYCTVVGNYLDSVANACLFLGSAHNYVARNILIPSAIGVEAIEVSAYNQTIIGNAIFTPVANTVAGVLFDAAVHRNCVIHDNLIEGFSGVGGAGIDFGGAGQHVMSYANNSFYGNADDTINDCDINYDEGNESLAASPFLKDGAMTFANRFNYFAPAATVRGTAYPDGCRFDRGAVQSLGYIAGYAAGFDAGFAAARPAAGLVDLSGDLLFLDDLKNITLDGGVAFKASRRSLVTVEAAPSGGVILRHDAVFWLPNDEEPSVGSTIVEGGVSFNVLGVKAPTLKNFWETTCRGLEVRDTDATDSITLMVATDEVDGHGSKITTHKASLVFANVMGKIHLMPPQQDERKGKRGFVRNYEVYLAEDIGDVHWGDLLRDQHLNEYVIEGWTNRQSLDEISTIAVSQDPGR